MTGTCPDLAVVDVVLPVCGDVVALLEAVPVLVERWPGEVDARLVVPSGPLTARDRTLLAGLGDEVVLVEVPGPGPTLGELVAAATAGSSGPVVVLDPRSLPSAEAIDRLGRGCPADGGVLLAPGAMTSTPVLSAATGLAGLAALLVATAPASAEEVVLGSAREGVVPDVEPSRPGLVSVVIPVWNQLRLTQACLESVRRCTRRPYEVVVVDNGSTDGTGAWLAAQPDVVVVSNPDNRGFAAACNQGMAASRGEVVVLLNNDTVVPRFWVDGLLRGLAVDGRVAAVGPRSNSVSGHQNVPEASYDTVSDFRTWADSWRRRHRGRTEEVERLVGFCLALRRSALVEVGGLDEGYGTGNFEDDDLCLRLRRAGWTLHVAHEVFVHHAGSATFRAAGSYAAAFAHGYRHHRAKWDAEDVLLSACLIVKDEQEALPRCLASLRGRVDEVVVCDTGSSDRTVEIAEACGARVVHVPWTGDFAAARNAALEACRGRWVLSVDADEQLGLEAGHDLRPLVASLGHDAGAVTVRSRSNEAGAHTFEHAAGRLLRRGRVRWVGAVHESLVDTRTGRTPSCVAVPGVWLDHDGYLDRVYAARDKATRNLLLAEKDHARACATGDRSRTWKTGYELARALSKDPGNDSRVEQLVLQALDAMPAGLAHLRCDALVRLAVAQGALGRPGAAVDSAQAALAVSPDDAAAALVLGQALAVDGRHEEAADLLRVWSARPFADGAVTDLHKRRVEVPQLHARVLLHLGRRAEASVLVQPLAETAADDVDWVLLHATLQDHPDRTELLARLAAHAPAAALAGLAGLPEAEQHALVQALTVLGVDAQAHTPAAQRAAHLDAALRGHDPDAVALAALVLEESDLDAALDLWCRTPRTDVTTVARARCLVQLGRTAEAVDEVEQLGDPQRLSPADLLVVVAVAGAAGDAGTAQALLDLLVAPDATVAQQARALARTLGLALPDRVDSALVAR